MQNDNRRQRRNRRGECRLQVSAQATDKSLPYKGCDLTECIYIYIAFKCILGEWWRSWKCILPQIRLIAGFVCVYRPVRYMRKNGARTLLIWYSACQISNHVRKWIIIIVIIVRRMRICGVFSLDFCVFGFRFDVSIATTCPYFAQTCASYIYIYGLADIGASRKYMGAYIGSDGWISALSFPSGSPFWSNIYVRCIYKMRFARIPPSFADVRLNRIYRMACLILWIGRWSPNVYWW